MPQKVLMGVEAAAGGAIKHVTYLASSLNRELFDVTVVYSDLRDEPNLAFYFNEMVDRGVRIRRVRMHRSIHPIQDIRSFISVLSFVRKEGFDIVHAHSSKAGFLFRVAAWLCRVPTIIYTPHCFYFQSIRGFNQWLFIRVERILALISTNIVVSDLELSVARKFAIAPDHKLCNINNAIPFAEPFPCVPPNIRKNEYKKLDIHSEYLVGSVGRLEHQKGWMDLLKVARQVVDINPQVKFLIVGSGSLKDQLLNLIVELDLKEHVIITGYVFNIQYVYQILDLYVSTSKWEGLPYTILEAISFKKTIVATDIGYPENLIDRQWQVKIGDYESMANKILDLLSNKALREEIGKEKYKWTLQNCSYKNFIVKHERLYTS